jgi:hypothetical protein
MNILLVGSTRSGTAWLGEVLANAFYSELNFEPLEPSYTKVCHANKLRNRYLNPGYAGQIEHEFLEKVVKGKLYSLPIKTQGPYNPVQLINWKFWRRNKLAKIIQGHLLVQYFASNFNVKIVYCRRNLCAVIESLLRQSWWRSDLHEFIDGRNETLWLDYPEIKSSFSESVKLLKSWPSEVPDQDCTESELVKRTAIRWALENSFVSNHCHGFLDSTISYEGFFFKPEESIEKIAKDCGVFAMEHSS